jgi:glycosyltransferase involved in cell wall biosynthesis
MRALHLIKTSDGAHWAALQVRELVRSGVEVDVALPSLTGRSVNLWNSTGARLHEVDFNFPVRSPWLLNGVARRARALIEAVQPDVIHSHFVSTTLTLRAASTRRTPRLFQVPGPLHLEHWLYRSAEIACSSACDYWIASSRYTRNLYLRAGVEDARAFLSYYGTETNSLLASPHAGLRGRLGIPQDALVIGNINLFYRPKRYLGQFTGIKAHEDLIEALQIVTSARANTFGVLAGGPWLGAQGYFEKLQRRAHQAAPGRILLPGPLEPAEVHQAWKEFDCAIHAPRSENCGGVVEPLLAGIPLVAGRVGGLPEVVLDGVTGVTVPIRNPRAMAHAILEVLAEREAAQVRAETGRRLVHVMFSPQRTAAEIKGIYEYVLGRTAEPPGEFDASKFTRRKTAETAPICA